MAIFFKPSDITTHICTIANKTKGGSAFAVCENGEQVFISPKIVDLMRLDVGDMLTAYCVDNHRERDDEQRFSVRWRAIRVSIKERFEPSAPQAAVAPIVALPAVIPPAAPEESLQDRILALLQQDRVWSSVQLAEALGVSTGQVNSWTWWNHRKGRIASARIYSTMEQEKASHVVYAKDIDILRRAMGI